MFAVGAEPDGGGLDVIARRVWDAVDNDYFFTATPGYICDTFAVGTEDGRADRNQFKRPAFDSVDDSEVSRRALCYIGDALAVGTESDLGITPTLGKRRLWYVGIGLP